MTPTASSSSILPATPSAASGASAGATNAQVTPDGGLGGFGLLLGAMQQALSTTAASADSAGSTALIDETQSGNEFPQPGMLLPLPGDAATTDAVLSKESDGNKQEDTNETDVDFLLFGASQPTPVSTTKNVSGSQSVNGTQDSVGDISASNAADELAAPIATGLSATDKESSNSKTEDKGVSFKAALAEFAPTAASAKPAAKTLQSMPDTVSSVESDFDTLIKHFDTSSPQLTIAPAGVGESSSVNHASRTYSNTMSNSAAIPVPVGQDGWSDAVADKVMWFSANKISTAEIHLNPPDLGPLQVRVSTQNDQASVVFTSQHAAVRDALDQALPRLRDMMGSQGMQLLDVSVGGQTPQQQQQFARNDSAQSGAPLGGFMNDEAAETSANVTSINTARLVRSGVDAYA